MKYKIVRTDKADDQLREMIFYIAEDSGSVDTAWNYLDKIKTVINHLENSPMFGSVPRYSIITYNILKDRRCSQ